jgi:hypothetical protein
MNFNVTSQKKSKKIKTNFIKKGRQYLPSNGDLIYCSQLEMVAKSYQLRNSKAGDAAAQAKPNQVFYYIVSLQIQKTNDLLSTL